MVESSVDFALAEAMRLHAKINKASSITALDKLKKSDPYEAGDIKKDLEETILQIQIAVDIDKKNGTPIKAKSIKQLQKFQLLFVAGLKKLGGRASVVPLI